MTCRVQASPPPSALDLSPTEVQDWMLCPSYWRWRHVERWLPKTVGKNEVQAWIGRAIHAGIAAWCTGYTAELTSKPLDAAMTELSQAHAEARQLGRDLEWTETKDREVSRTISRALLAFLGQAPEWLRTECFATELRLGRAVLDWIGLPHGEWLIVDFKTKKKRPYNLEAYQWENRRSWQFADYVDRVRTHPDSPARGGTVQTVQVQTIILDEFEVLTDTFTPSLITDGEHDTVQGAMWISYVNDRPWRNRSKCRNWFGEDCPYLRACWDYEGDPQRMTVDYVKKEDTRAVS